VLAGEYDVSSLLDARDELEESGLLLYSPRTGGTENQPAGVDGGAAVGGVDAVEGGDAELVRGCKANEACL